MSEILRGNIYKENLFSPWNLQILFVSFLFSHVLLLPPSHVARKFLLSFHRFPSSRLTPVLIEINAFQLIRVCFYNFSIIIGLFLFLLFLRMTLSYWEKVLLFFWRKLYFLKASITLKNFGDVIYATPF